MKVLQIHNYYLQRGGEDEEADREAEMLEEAGHRVLRYLRSNREIAEMGAWEKLGLAVRASWAADAAREVEALVRRERPDVAHCHNTLALISPAVHRVLSRNGIPSVQTLHNYRLFCAAGTLSRDGRVCEDCLGRSLPWPAVLHACYRGSRLQSSVLAAAQVLHRRLGTWESHVGMFIAPTEFLRRKCVEQGIPEDRLAVKPNLARPAPAGRGTREGGALFVGRLSREKGVRTLLEAWERLRRKPPLTIVGDGPERARVLEAARRAPELKYLGRQENERVMELMRGASVLVVPSIWYEVFPMVILEAYSCGTPVLASRVGSLTELVKDGATGATFLPGDPAALAEAVDAFLADPEAAARMGRGARAEFEGRYGRARNCRTLIEIYERAAARVGGRGGAH